MGLFDDLVVEDPRPACPVCGGWAGRRSDGPGQVVQPHDRADQAMYVDAGNPCPGEGRLSVLPG